LFPVFSAAKPTPKISAKKHQPARVGESRRGGRSQRRMPEK
jgi:hypothetical protein